MDQQLEKYRFGITLDLEASVYTFIFPDPSIKPVSTVCQFFRPYLTEQGVLSTLVSGNTYLIISGETREEISILLEFFWATNGYTCQEL